MPFNVDHPQEWSLYELTVGHRLKDDTPIGAGEHFVHPNDCDDCKDPETHVQVQKDMEVIENAITEIAPFFSDDTPRELLLNIGMSFHMQMLEAYR